MNICPNCGFDKLKEEYYEEAVSKIFCAQCDTELADCIVLSRDEAVLLSTHVLNTAFLPRDFYEKLHPIIKKIIRFADTGKES